MRRDGKGARTTGIEVEGPWTADTKLLLFCSLYACYMFYVCVGVVTDPGVGSRDADPGVGESVGSHSVVVGVKAQ